MVSTLQSIDDLEKWHRKNDPWQYNDNPEDKKRKLILLSQLPQREYKNVLDIGCGQGFITKDLPGRRVVGVDVSKNAIKYAKKIKKKGLSFITASIFDLNNIFKQRFDLIVITGVLYRQYIGDSHNLIYLIIDNLLEKDGVLVSVHHDEWCQAKFPYLMPKQSYYDYRDFVHRLEVYNK